QALLGFQFVGVLTDAFDRLPAGSRHVHVASLLLSAVTVTLLIAPAAFHRLAERGEATPRQLRVSTAFLLASMVTLPPAMTGDLFVVVRKATDSGPLAAAVAAGVLVLFYAVWFVPGAVVRLRQQRRPAA
ncbi:MAG: hypothetical protein JWO31_1820, partial [Phycisphaerales bacterium]|nr:hypothetical protein [Phycisphaerales bacterium]